MFLEVAIEEFSGMIALWNPDSYWDATLAALECLTVRPDEPYDAFIARVLLDPVATRVKMLDIEDNMDMRRIASLTEKDVARLAKYHRARARLLAALDGENLGVKKESIS